MTKRQQDLENYPHQLVLKVKGKTRRGFAEALVKCALDIMDGAPNSAFGFGDNRDKTNGYFYFQRRGVHSWRCTACHGLLPSAAKAPPVCACGNSKFEKGEDLSGPRI